MSLERLLKHRWILVAGVWTVPALLAAFETFMFWHLSGRSYPFWRAFAMEGPAWFTYAALTPVIFALARRFPLQRKRIVPHLAIHLVASLAAGAVYAAAASYSTLTFSPMPQRLQLAGMTINWFLSALPLCTLTYFGILGVGIALMLFAEARQREMDAARLSAQLAEARLGALRMQLHPHFLFNTLNAITVLAKDGDTASVSRMLTLLSSLLRDVLRNDDVQFVTLDAELRFSRQYLEIELVRFADRLHVRESIAAGAERFLVPVFILQSLIENALRHGLAPRAAGGSIEIGARDGPGYIDIWVSDDGVGLPSDWGADDRYGIGLSNVAARLRALYGDNASLAIAPEALGGTRASLRIPSA